jgi:hypothetical protein
VYYGNLRVGEVEYFKLVFNYFAFWVTLFPCSWRGVGNVELACGKELMAGF